ncbi:protein kinase domain-containing protein [Pelovirga terrestris]|uniref:non-specific serine/threonine protein kinase n=1 Tax=Pelovirga terrestris TaxID=2771352 RepID=A0A8J6UIH7_9BACT|nr:tetratricopeptide repeat protein [Pelovirga terrestris]MBD1400965.1 tetratricopeptide repeat protein [Pelovirga terrestris]
MLDQGQTIADCTVIRLLAQFDSHLEYLVATGSVEQKLVQFTTAPDWSRAQRQAFHHQMETLCGLKIPAVGVPVRAVEYESALFCLYPLPPGEPLQKTLSAEHSVRSSLELIHTLTTLLEPAHRQQLFHGALSPHSLYLDNGQPYLADFSLASLVVFDYRTAVEAEYASPEQIRGEPPGTASDIYSLGCLFYALLTGRPPFLGSDAFTVGMQHLNDGFPELPAPLVFCAELLKGMTVKPASERLSLAQVRSQCEELLSLEALDQIPARIDALPPASDEETRIQLDEQDAMAMVARIEDQLRAIEAKTTDDAATTQSQAEEELSLSFSASPPSKISSPRRFFFMLVGLVVGFCLGALFFDFFLARSSDAPPPPVFAVEAVPPDYTNSTRLWLEGDLEGAQRDLKRLLENFPDHPQIHNNLAAVAAARGDIESAREWLEQAIVLDAQTATIYRNLGSVYAEIARGSYGRALQFDYEQHMPLQLNFFTNQGVASMPSGVDPDSVPVIAASNEGGATQTEAESVVPLSAKSRPEESMDRTSVPAGVPAGADQVDTAMAESTVILSQKAADSPIPVVEPQPGPAGEEVVPGDVAAAAVVSLPEDPVRFLQRWAATWSAQDIEGYLAFYSDEFEPAGGLDYEEWIRQRRQRLGQPEEILVTLGEVDLRRETESFVQLEVIQDYHSERYSDRTRKLFELRRQGSSWAIERERALELMYR